MKAPATVRCCRRRDVCALGCRRHAHTTIICSSIRSPRYRYMLYMLSCLSYFLSIWLFRFDRPCSRVPCVLAVSACFKIKTLLMPMLSLLYCFVMFAGGCFGSGRLRVSCGGSSRRDSRTAPGSGPAGLDVYANPATENRRI